MSSEIPYVRSSLELDFADRVLEYLTNLNIDRVGMNAHKATIIERLGEVTTERLTSKRLDTIGESVISSGIIDGANEAPWSAYMKIMDGITDAEAKRAEKAGAEQHFPMNTLVRFDSGLARDRFHFVAESLLAGIPMPLMPRIRPAGRREVVMHNVTYADIATFGRIGTALLRRQYNDLGPNLRLLTQGKIKDIVETGLHSHLPENLANRVSTYQEDLGDNALVSSGRLGKIGRAARQILVLNTTEIEWAESHGVDQEKLRAQMLTIQRRPGFTPAIEARTRFISDGKDIPISRTPVNVAVKEQFGEHIRDYKRMYGDRDWVKFVQEIWELSEGLGAAHIGTTVRAMGTVATALYKARRGMTTDRRLLREIDKNNNKDV